MGGEQQLVGALKDLVRQIQPGGEIVDDLRASSFAAGPRGGIGPPRGAGAPVASIRRGSTPPAGPAGNPRHLSPQVNSVVEIWNRRDDEPTRLGRHTNPVDAFRRELRTGGDEAFSHPGPGAVVCMPAGHGRRSSDRSAGF